MESWDEFARAEPEIAAKGIELLDQRGDGERMSPPWPPMGRRGSTR